jgi:hypothetical protein
MRLSAFISSLAFTLLAACGGSSTATKATTTPTTSTTTAPSAGTDDDSSCPVAVAGTSVTVEDTETGAALVFVTTGDENELRKRVSAMAAMHNEQHRAMGPLPTGNEAGGGHDHHAHHDMSANEHASHGAHASGSNHAGHAGGMIGVHSAASAEELSDGARLVFIVAPADIGKLQTELRTHAQHLSSGTCEMAH